MFAVEAGYKKDNYPDGKKNEKRHKVISEKHFTWHGQIPDN